MTRRPRGRQPVRMRTRAILPSIRAAAVVVVTAGLLVACGGSDDDPVAEPTSSTESSDPATEAGCAEVAELRTSAQALVEVEPLQDGLEAVRAAAADTRDALEAAVTEAATTLQPSVEAVQTELAAVRTALTDAARGGDAGEDAAAIGDALEGLGTALADLDTTLGMECPEQ